MESQMEFTVSVEQNGQPDPAAADELNQYLHGFPTLTVEQTSGETPEGGKGDPAMIGDLILSFTTTVLPALIAAIATVKAAQATRTIKVKVGDVEIVVPDGTDPTELEDVVNIASQAAKG